MSRRLFNESFKPCYKWNTFNTELSNGLLELKDLVLNLVISGIPSILKMEGIRELLIYLSFKPCYKWNTFNTGYVHRGLFMFIWVLNLVISGIPSILV